MDMTRRGRGPRRSKRPSADAAPTPAARAGRVVTHHGRSAVVEGSQGELRLCTTRRNVGTVVCGDRVEWLPVGPQQGVIQALLARSSLLARSDTSGRSRALAANVDQVLIVTAPEPPLSEALIDRYLVAAELLPARAVIVVNKIDLLNTAAREALAVRLDEYERIGYPVIFTTRYDPGTLEPLGHHLQDRISILVGQSGVGKSSLVNALVPDRDVRVGALSEATGLGRHTTSATTLYHLAEGGDLIDSPGVRDFHLESVNTADLNRSFREFGPYLGQCRFHNCRHDREPGCAVTAAADRGQISLRRLASYRQLLSSLHPQ